jgi:hypothetical protein
MATGTTKQPKMAAIESSSSTAIEPRRPARLRRRFMGNDYFTTRASDKIRRFPAKWRAKAVFRLRRRV